MVLKREGLEMRFTQQKLPSQLAIVNKRVCNRTYPLRVGLEPAIGPARETDNLSRSKDSSRYHLSLEDSTSAGFSIPNTPCILIMGNGLFKITVDQEVVNEHITSPIMALSYTFCLFYVLNIKYPKEMALTLEFIQRVFLGINPERGSKAEMKGTKHQHIPPRLLKFLYELNNFENP